ncbi:hypothetical protein [Actinopolymorpha pittospori]
MNAATKLGTFAVGLAVVFGGAVGVGRMVGPLGASADSGSQAGSQADHGQNMAPSMTPANASIPGGLQISQDGYTLTPQTTTLAPGQRTDFRFTVTGPDGRPVTRFATLHEKKLHFIVAGRDLSGFQHLHPVQTENGVWSVPLTLPAAGNYRAFADFQAEGAREGLTLGMDLSAPGDFAPRSLPRATSTATVDDYTVAIKGVLVPGRTSKLTLSVSKDGKPVTDLQPYLGAYGHLVALRAGDLAYLHVHPDGEPGDGSTKPGPDIPFYAEVPSAGSYRLYLDFQHQGTVRTAEFTAIAGTPDAGATTAPSPPPAGDDGHDH